MLTFTEERGSKGSQEAVHNSKEQFILNILQCFVDFRKSFCGFNVTPHR